MQHIEHAAAKRMMMDKAFLWWGTEQEQKINSSDEIKAI